uniref:Uncharacterized protein n=1 Tax=Picea glauca TaxID=3330 RepID=A0A101M3Y7_PICGL|nr:hypothetical protein ABT39_MTgene320 [Picea glauca]QHR90682.1 hypothetical protein Q903MT_gene4707 [Picea sitchensis]
MDGLNLPCRKSNSLSAMGKQDGYVCLNLVRNAQQKAVLPCLLWNEKTVRGGMDVNNLVGPDGDGLNVPSVSMYELVRTVIRL